MENNSLNSESQRARIINILGIILRLIGLLFLGTAITLAVFGTAIATKETFTETDKVPLLIMQGFNHLVTFIFLPLLYVFYFKRSLASELGIKAKNSGVQLALASLLVIATIPLINILAEWNKAIDPPDLWGIDYWVRTSEEKAKKLTDLIAMYDNIPQMLLIFSVMAILPAIGEEILFRGIIQNEFREVIKNPHAAIWISGFIFSFMHFQFFGFFPRMLLGVIFGYLYFWSGNLLIPIFIHFLNNALTLLAMNLYKDGTIGTNPESVEAIPVWTIILSLVMFVYLLSAFKKYSQKDNEGKINS
jgi:membrane protease YdiL (CAAX protease family)